MKKILSFLIIIIFGLIGYLKTPYFNSGVSNTYFDTEINEYHSLSVENGVLLLKNLVGILEKISYKTELSLIKDAILKEVKIYMKIKKKTEFEYDENVSLDLDVLINFENIKLKYLELYISKKGKGRKLAIQILKNSLKNNLFMLKKTEGNLFFIETYTKLVYLDLQLLKKVLSLNILEKYEIVMLKKSIKELNLDDKNLRKAIKKYIKNSILSLNENRKYKYVLSTKLFSNTGIQLNEKIEGKDGKIRENNFKEEIGKSSKGIFKKILTFFTFNRKETVELYKFYGKNILEGKDLLPEGGFKNISGKKTVYKNLNKLKKVYKNFNNLINILSKIK